MCIPRNEYPRPQLVREDWLNLNGEWEFEIDYAASGTDREFYKRTHLNDKIIVPFCPESKLSGVGNTDFLNCVWYRKNLEIPVGWKGKEILLHFGAVDYEATVYVNGEKVFIHKGGYTPFCVNITPYLKEKDNHVTLCATDDVRLRTQPAGKQSGKYQSYGCFYTRTTGIWQTVWMEAVEKAYIKNIKYTTDIHTGTVLAQVQVSSDAVGCEVAVSTSFKNNPTGKAKTTLSAEEGFVAIPLTETHLWGIGQGNLYDTTITLTKDGKIIDTVTGYFGMREVSLKDKAFWLNGEVVFGRWVLDQGFYPDGIYTAPTDEDLKNDILYAQEFGFNGARMHEKVFEPRYLYWADRLGYLVWGEHANWGLNVSVPEAVTYFLPEWIEAMERDYSHPSLIGWCPLNETWDEPDGKRQCNDVLRTIYEATKALDKTRPVIDASGNFHVVTDIFDIHCYEQDPQRFKTRITSPEQEGNPYYPERQAWHGEPLFVSEYGGIQWAEEKDGWGYGNAPKTKEELIARYRGLTNAILENEDMIGFCYTQLYDVEQEQNGLMTYQRTHKFDPKTFYDINTQPAAIEKKFKK